MAGPVQDGDDLLEPGDGEVGGIAEIEVFDAVDVLVGVVVVVGGGGGGHELDEVVHGLEACGGGFLDGGVVVVGESGDEVNRHGRSSLRREKVRREKVEEFSMRKSVKEEDGVLYTQKGGEKVKGLLEGESNGGDFVGLFFFVFEIFFFSVEILKF